MASTASAVTLGLYAKKRSKFRRDFTYNKYHFGCAVQILAAVGMSASAKMPAPYKTGILFVSAICLTSLPAYYEGFNEIRDLPDSEYDTSAIRRIGIYCLIGGDMALLAQNRTSLMFAIPK